MKTKTLKITIPVTLIIIILALIPFHAFLTVWLSSLIGHYTALRLWKEYLLAILVLFSLYFIIKDKEVRDLFRHFRVIQLIILFLVIELIWGIVARRKGDVNTKALLYGWLSDTRYLIFFIVTLIFAKKTGVLKFYSLKLILYPALVVIIFGLLEILVLPKNFLSHFGYGPSTIYPYQTINHNSHYVRILSTLRGSDSLGAYMLVPLSLLSILIVKGRKRLKLGLFFLGGVVVLIFSFSRSAWLGFILSLIAAIYLSLKSSAFKRYFMYISLAVIVILAGFFIAERNNSRVQNIVFHTQKNSSIKSTSDAGHASALKTGLKQLASEPLGRGPGTSGPASVYNSHPARITENYYIQIGQEVGWLGLIVFVSINVLVVLSLWNRREDNLSLALLCAFIGITVCNLLLESWTDDTLAYLWWGLAGIAIAVPPKNKRLSKNNPRII